MTLQNLLNKATHAGFKITHEQHRVLVYKTNARTNKITSGVWIGKDGQKVLWAFRTDIDLALTTTIRSVSQTAKILGI
jgi:hypothetical protein